MHSLWQVVEERREQRAPGDHEVIVTTPTYQYVWSGEYIDSPALRDEDTDADGLCDDGRLYYLTDANYNVTAVVNQAVHPAYDQVVERYVYDPYGKATIYNADWSQTVQWPNSRKSELLYAGYRYDHESGNYHVRNRSYHPALGRWLQRDPVGYVDGMSLYEYVRSGPLAGTDPQGLAICAPLWSKQCMQEWIIGGAGFKICQRDVLEESWIDKVVNYFGGQHAYVGCGNQYAEDERWGYGFTKPGVSPERAFGPTRCASCKKTDPCKTDAEIKACIAKHKPRRSYGYIRYNCKAWAREAAAACWLSCGSI